MTTTKTTTQASQEHETCKKRMLPVRDALEVLNGKWKLPIMLSISFGAKRFKQISKDVGDITDKMLSKHLKELETNQLIIRKVYDTFPPTVEYSITEHGMTLRKVIKELADWGQIHRNKIIGH
ncbi:MAG: helix-turn-helix transcriptional regulator [Saprospiraceae bacterium]|nr:helix-turn-helix transcriptional regulator [Saprospiraceae bacterium]